jgi:hypothetical protein
MHGVRDALLPHDEELEKASEAGDQEVLPAVPGAHAAQGEEEVTTGE